MLPMAPTCARVLSQKRFKSIQEKPAAAISDATIPPPTISAVSLRRRDEYPVMRAACHAWHSGSGRTATADKPTLFPYRQRLRGTLARLLVVRAAHTGIPPEV